MGKPALDTLPLSVLVFSALCSRSASARLAALPRHVLPHLSLLHATWALSVGFFHCVIGNFCMFSAAMGKGQQATVK